MCRRVRRLPVSWSGRRSATDPAASDLEPAVELVKQGRVGPWPPSQDALKGLAERLEETDQQSADRVWRDAPRAGRHGDPRVPGGDLPQKQDAAREAHRFRESGYVFWKRGDEEAARTCLAAALAFESSPIGENPVAHSMLEVPLAPVLEKIDQEGEETRGLPPGEALEVFPWCWHKAGSGAPRCARGGWR